MKLGLDILLVEKYPCKLDVIGPRKCHWCGAPVHTYRTVSGKCEFIKLAACQFMDNDYNCTRDQEYCEVSTC